MSHAPAASGDATGPTRAAALLGSTLDDRYRFEQRIGAGGLGEVFRASHLRMDRSFAIKLLQPTVAAQPDFVERFDREAKALSRLSHPYCVEVTDYGVSPEHGPYIVMELLEGVPLSQITKASEAPKVELSLGTALELCRKVLLGLEHAHEQGIAHRDLKPDNIMVVPDPVEPGAYQPKILDFGLAKIHAGDAECSALTHAGLIIGTPYYMSPERIAAPHEADAKTGDLYALGVLLYELCCGQRPFVGPDMMSTLTLHMTQAPRPPRELAPALPLSLEAVILRALEKRPADRFASATEFRQALEALLPLPAAAASLPAGAAAHVGPEAETVSASAVLTNAHAPSADTSGATRATRVEGPSKTGKARAGRRRSVPLWGLLLGVALLLAAGALVTFALVSGDGAPPVDAPKHAAVSDTRPPPARKGAVRKRVPRVATAPRVVGRRVLAKELRRATRLWAHRWSQRRAARLFGKYLARHRHDAWGHLHVARLYLLRLWAADGVETLEHALAAEPTLKLDDATLIGLAFAYRSKRRATARRLLVAHAGPRAVRVLLTAAAAIQDKDLRQRQLDHARKLGPIDKPLDQQLLSLALKTRCSSRRAALEAVVQHHDPLVRELLALLKQQPCVGKMARRHLAAQR